MKSFNKILAKERKKQGLTVLDLSKLSGVHRATIYAFEAGKDAHFNGTILKLAKALNYKIEMVKNDDK